MANGAAAISVGDPEVSASWLQPDPVLTTVAIGGANLQLEELPIPTSPYFF